MSFDLARIERETFVEGIEFHQQIASTNDRAMELAAAHNLPTPHLVLATRQMAGRGRGANRWWAGEGSLTFSLVLDWDPARSPLGTPGGPGAWPQISLATALAVCEVVKQIVRDVSCGIRWPNDVHADGKKICGVLPEVPKLPAAQEPDGHKGRLVLGIGVNVNNRISDAPPEIQTIATSLCELAQRPPDMTDVLVRILKGIERNLSALDRADPALPQEWSRHCLLSGRTVELSLGSRLVRGLCRGIDADGALLLHCDGTTQRFHGGVIARVY